VKVDVNAVNHLPVHTTCPYCGVGCGVVARDGGIAADRDHPSNFGRLCSKGAALGQTLNNRGRLTAPLVGGKSASWEAALDLIAEKYRSVIAAHGPDSTAFYVSGQFLTEDYYVANKLMKGFIGSGNIDTNSRLCMASSVAGHVRAFGEDIVPGIYEDFELADLVVLVGSNLSWCHPVLYQRMMAARKQRGMRIVVIDPRRTATAESADLHLPIALGTDTILFNTLLVFMAENNGLDRNYIADHCTGFDETLKAATADAPDMETAAAFCGIDPEIVEIFFEWFRRTPRSMTVYSQGVNQSSAGTDKVNAIINCHLAAGRIGKPGAGPFSVTGQPNAMGGREVGGLANQLAAHTGFYDAEGAERISDFWKTTNLATKPGFKAVDLFEATLAGNVQALWIAATNPAVSMPRAQRVREALKTCPFLVVSDCWMTDTADFADVVLPAAGWGEKDGTVTNSERRISRQRGFRKAPGDARPDWWMFAELGKRLGFAKDFAWTAAHEVFNEHVALTSYRNEGRKLLDLGGLGTLDRAGYDALQPQRWPLPKNALQEGGRLFATGGFPTADGRARLIPVSQTPRPEAAPGDILLNTGRIRDQWHSMTRTGEVPALTAHTPEPIISLHPQDAARFGIGDGDLVRITGQAGSAVLRAGIAHTQRHGEAFAPMHWSSRFANGGVIEAAVSAKCDPLSGQPELKASSIRLARIAPYFHGVLVRLDSPMLPSSICHAVRIVHEEGSIYKLAGIERPLPHGADLPVFASTLLPDHDAHARMEIADHRLGAYRAAVFANDRLIAALFITRDAALLPQPSSILALLGTELSPAQRAVLLAGRAPATGEEGPRVCACFGVSEGAIRHAVVTHRLGNTSEIGAFLRAGTNCGSCLPELERILRDVCEPV
jgi:assimilatory nitrate reductase catalytic subunit